VNTNIKRRKVLGTLIVGGLVQACGGGGGESSSGGVVSIGTGGGTGGSNPPPVISPSIPEPVIEVGPTLSDFAGQPLYIAHRGSSAMYPEETYIAYDESVKNGDILLEGDVNKLGDGNLGMMHDATVDRTTSGTGAVTAFNATSWNALRVDSGTWHGSNYGNDLSVPLFRDWIQKYRTKAIFVPEDKDGRSMSAMLAVFDELKLNRDKVLLQCFSLEPLKLAMKAGYQACFLNNNSATSIETVKAAGVGWVGLPMSKAEDLKKWTDSGLKVLVWTVNRRFQRDESLGVAVRGFFSDDPAYFKADKPISKTDQFSKGTWVPGMLGNGSDTSLELRGEFFTGGYWGYSSQKASYLSCLHGSLCPIKSAAAVRSFDIDFKLTFDAALSNDNSRSASVFLGIDDRPFMDGNEWSAGYSFVLRKNGAVEIYKKALGAKAVLMQTAAGSPIADGQEVGYRIRMTENTVSVVRLNSDGSTGNIALANDRSFDTAYLHLGRTGLACKFRQISIT
jgi:glycerophosphoryl diester phosphodiesterase